METLIETVIAWAGVVAACCVMSYSIGKGEPLGFLLGVAVLVAPVTILAGQAGAQYAEVAALCEGEGGELHHLQSGRYLCVEPSGVIQLPEDL